LSFLVSVQPSRGEALREKKQTCCHFNQVTWQPGQSGNSKRNGARRTANYFRLRFRRAHHSTMIAAAITPQRLELDRRCRDLAAAASCNLVGNVPTRCIRHVREHFPPAAWARLLPSSFSSSWGLSFHDFYPRTRPPRAICRRPPSFHRIVVETPTISITEGRRRTAPRATDEAASACSLAANRPRGSGQPARAHVTSSSCHDGCCRGPPEGREGAWLLP
jgi:hypothetical protein